MAKPPWVWTNGWDFPKLYTWEYKAKMELFDLFDYDPDLEELNNLKEPNFETFSLPSICKGANNVLLKRYCKVTKHIPDLHTTMLLMQLAKFPLTFKEDLKKKFRFDLIVISPHLFLYFRYFSSSNTSLPKISFIPTCFYGMNAAKFWNAKDYSFVDALNSILPDEFKADLETEYHLRQSDFYKYPKCELFSPMPTDSGICHTFNGLALEKILKPSIWRNSFNKSFGGSKNEQPLKSVGVDIEDGLVFSLDTLQHFMINLQKRAVEQNGLNKFWIKVHTAGEIPWIFREKSTWTKVEAFDLEMSTRFITLKGEKIDHKEEFRKIPQNIRKCFFPDEGNLELFEFYSEANCQLECAWKHAEEVCGRKPWFVPSSDGSQMCFILGNVCFYQIMRKIEKNSIQLACHCEVDCIISRYSLTIEDNESLERSSPKIFHDINYGENYINFGTDVLNGFEFSNSEWYNMGKLLLTMEIIIS